MEFKFCFLIMI